jgi:hypothetical protein
MTWDDLRALRESGQKPLSLVVTTDWGRCRSLADAGAMVVVHRKGDPMPIELLAGLDVELRLDECRQACAVARLLRSKDISPATTRAWCACDGSVDSMWPYTCAAKRDMDTAWEALCSRAV